MPDYSAGEPSWRDLLRRKSFWQLALVAFIALLMSKGGTLLPGMAPDDYVQAVNGIPRSVVNVMIGQGRALNALLAIALGTLNAPLASIDPLAFPLACASIAFAIAVSLSLIKRSADNRIHDYLACLLAATYPYLTSYFLFRMNLLNMAFVYAALAVSLLFLAYHRRVWHLVVCAIVLAIFCQMSQITITLFVVTAGAWSLERFCRARAADATVLGATRAIITMVCVTIGAFVLYTACSRGIRMALHLHAVPQYTVHLTTGLGGALTTAFNLVYEVLFAQESILPTWLKIWMIVAILAVVFTCIARKPIRGIATLVLLIGGLLVSVSPMAFSWGELVPRVFSPAGLCLALVLSMACDGAPARIAQTASAVLVVPVLCFCVIGASVLHEQFTITQWDQRTADAIFQRAAPIAMPGAPIRIAARWPIHGMRLGYNGPGIGESAFIYPWDLQGLFAVATGHDVKVVSDAPATCRNTPAWPSRHSIRRLTDGSVLVCMIHGSVDTIQRDYPSASQEAALRLNYPLFVRYGAGMVRITPFFPGTSMQPVAVKLAPHFGGYRLHAQGRGCAFPVDFTLVGADGKQLATGAYIRGVAHLPSAQTKAMKLSIRMAPSAKNNYDCNLIVAAAAQKIGSKNR